MENSSERFLAANRNFSQATRDIESIQASREAATRGRSEDIIPAYQALRPQGQAPFRARYLEPLVAQTQGSAPGVKLASAFENWCLAQFGRRALGQKCAFAVFWRATPIFRQAPREGSAPRIAGIGLQDFSKISPTERQELFVWDAGRG